MIKTDILRLNRNPELSQWFQDQLDQQIAFGLYHNDIATLRSRLVSGLSKYKMHYNISNVVIGISGGIDSAVTAALFKQAGWNVTGVLMPIHQDPEETARGRELCEALEIEFIEKDLTEEFDFVSGKISDSDKIRQGNIRARLRMITLYDLASAKGGLVASTDNFSELAAGFWTLHGDVGDVSPIQALSKSWEVPALAEALGVPQSIVEAVPTDGLGIANGDEDQFGFSYLEFDLALFKLMRGGIDLDTLTEEDKKIVQAVADRVRSTTYKRANPFNLTHPLDASRYEDLEQLDIYLRS